MSWYFVTHPNLDLTAVVDAPATEKARTTFLDYLERRGLLNRAHRGYFRENMVAERINDPSSVVADIELSYGYEPMPEASSRLEPAYLPEGVGSEFSGGEPIELTGSEEVSLPEESLSPPRKRMPIQEVMLRGFER